MWLALLYAFGTPVFFRTGFLNHNLMLGHIAFAGFLAMWDPGRSLDISWKTRAFLGGIAGGLTVLFDYSGVVFLLGLFGYAMLARWRDEGRHTVIPTGFWYVLGSIPPILVLWFYQWRAFGNPFLPGQHWMPPVQWIELGYQGYGGPQLELLIMLVADHRFGLFAAAPLLLLGLAAPFLRRDNDWPALETWTCIALFVATWVFFAGSNYTRLQFNTGIRYMAPVLPFLFLPTARVLVRWPRAVQLWIAVPSVVLAWAMAMNREVWRPLGVLEPVARVLTGGFELPALTTIERMREMFGDFLPHGVSPLPLFALAGVILWLIWSAPPRRSSDADTLR